MKVLITGDVNREGQWHNVQRLWEQVRQPLEQVGATVEVEFPRPRSDWVAGYDAGPFELRTDADLVIGFELPPSAKKSLAKWIDVRIHPIRWGQVGWSLGSNLALGALPAEEVPQFPSVAPMKLNVERDALFTCQVHTDAAMIRDGKFATFEDVAAELTEYAKRFDRLLISPHPAELNGPWVTKARERVPNAIIVDIPTYQLIAAVEHVCTYTSSTGIEAQACGKTVRFLGRAPHSGPFYDVSRADVWAAVVSACK